MSRRSEGNGGGIGVVLVKFVLACLVAFLVAGFVTEWFGRKDELPIPLPSLSTVSGDMSKDTLRKAAKERLDALMDPSSDEFVATVSGGKAKDGDIMQEDVIPYVSFADLMSVITKHMSYEIESVSVDGDVAVVRATVSNVNVADTLSEWQATMGDRTKWPQEIRRLAARYDAMPASANKSRQEEQLQTKLYDWGWQLFRELIDERKGDLQSNEVTLTYKRDKSGFWQYDGESGLSSAILGGSEFELVRILLANSAK